MSVVSATPNWCRGAFQNESGSAWSVQMQGEWALSYIVIWRWSQKNDLQHLRRFQKRFIDEGVSARPKVDSDFQASWNALVENCTLPLFCRTEAGKFRFTTTLCSKIMESMFAVSAHNAKRNPDFSASPLPKTENMEESFQMIYLRCTKLDGPVHIWLLEPSLVGLWRSKIGRSQSIFECHVPSVSVRDVRNWTPAVHFHSCLWLEKISF